MSATTKTYLIGVLNAVVSGAASTVAAVAVDHQDFNFSLKGVEHIAFLAGVSAIVSLAKWVLQHPVPDGEIQGGK